MMACPKFWWLNVSHKRKGVCELRCGDAMWRSEMALVAEIHRNKLSASILSVIVWSDQPIECVSLPAYGRLETK